MLQPVVLCPLVLCNIVGLHSHMYMQTYKHVITYKSRSGERKAMKQYFEFT